MSICLVDPALPCRASEFLDHQPVAGERAKLDIEAARTSQPTVAPLRLLVRDLRGKKPDGETLQRWRHGEWTTLAARRKAVSGGTLLSAETACQPGDRFLVTNTKALGITPPVKLCASDLALELRPRCDLSGALQLPANELSAAWSLLRFRPCDPAEEAGIVEIPVVLTGTGSFATDAPSGCFDLLAQVDDWAPARWPRVLLKSGETHRLDRRALAPGGALLARVVDEETGQPQVGVRVGLLAAGELGAAASAAAEGKPFHPLAAALTDDEGWFRLAGLPAGTYLLSLDDGRRWPHFTQAIGIRAGDEYFQPELPLPRPLRIQVEIVGEENFFAQVQELSVSLGRSEPGLSTLGLSASADETRTVRFSDLPPGQYQFTVAARLLGGNMQPVLSATHEIVAEQDGFLRLEIQGGLFHGIVTRDGEPQEGVLRLSTLPANVRGQRVTARTDDQGQFEVFLQQSGNYEASFSSFARRGERTMVPKIHFADPGSEVEIELPNGSIAGRVVDPQGNGVAGASIRAAAFGNPQEAGGLQILNQSTQSEADGSFALSGLPPATWSLTARAEPSSSDPLAIELAPDEKVEGVRIELREEEWVQVAVVDDQALPIGGATLEYSFLLSRFGEEQSGGSGRSDANGIVRVDARGHAGKMANFLLVTPAGSVSCQRSRLEAVTTLVATERTGTVTFSQALSIQEPTGLPEPPPLGQFNLALVSSTGCSFPLTKVSQVGPAPGQRTISRLAAGNWRLVRWHNLQDRYLLLSGRDTALPTEAQWRLDPGGRAEITVHSQPLLRKD